MGCDIHPYIEVKQQGTWKPLRKPEKCRYGDDRTYIHQEDWGRNYDLFAILADVRNGHGFAGVDTGDGFNPITAPKGVPDDCSDAIRDLMDDRDYHSHSHHTVQELLAYDWTQTTKHRGFVTAPVYHDWLGWGKKYGEAPKGYCGDVSGPSVSKITNEEMDKAIEKIAGDEDAYWKKKPLLEAASEPGKELHMVYTQLEWEETYHRSVGYFWQDIMPVLVKHGIEHDFDKVRIVFAFDN